MRIPSFLRFIISFGLALSLLLPWSSTPSLMAECSPSHRVVAGDTLSAIARTYNTTLPDLLTLNPGISNPNLIVAGQTICLPGGTADAQVHIRVEYSYTPHPEEEGLARLAADFRTGKSVVYPLISGMGLQMAADTQEIKTAIAQRGKLPVFYGVYWPQTQSYALVSVADSGLLPALRLASTEPLPAQQGCDTVSLSDALSESGVEITDMRAELRIDLGVGIDKPIKITHIAHIPDLPSINSCISGANISVDFALFPVDGDSATPTYQLMILFPFTGVGPQGTSSILDCETISQGSGLVYDFLRNFCPDN